MAKASSSALKLASIIRKGEDDGSSGSHVDGEDRTRSGSRRHSFRSLPLNPAKNPGCAMYQVHRHRTEPRRFFIYEQYKDDAALEAHRAHSAFSAVRKKRIAEGCGPGGWTAVRTAAAELAKHFRILTISVYCASSYPAKKKLNSKRAVSSASEPWMALCSMLCAHFLRIVPSSAFAGLVAPISLRRSAMAFSFSSAKRHDWSARHEIGERIEKSFGGVHRVELLRLMLGDLEHLHGQNAKVVLFELFDNVADRISAHGVRLNDGKSALQSFHKLSFV